MPNKDEPEMKITTVRLPVDLHRELAHRAIDEDLTPSEVIQMALREYLERAEGAVKYARGLSWTAA